MAHAIPMVRAMSLLPVLRWLDSNGHDARPFLRDSGLVTAVHSDPLRPTPLLRVGNLLRLISQTEGPDIPCRIVSDASILDLTLVGRVALGSRCPMEALQRISAALPLFCSHENLFVSDDQDTLVVRHNYGCRFDTEAAHLMLLYAIAMCDRLCAMTGATVPRIQHIEVLPHPIAGVDHLRELFGVGVVPVRSHAVVLRVPRGIAERSVSSIARDRMATSRTSSLLPLRGDGTFASSARIMLASMVEDGLPALRDLAIAAGTSTRTLQRRFSEEGTFFGAVLDEVRKERAERQPAGSDVSFLSIATELGYERQSSLTRDMRRWTGKTPSIFRKRIREGE
ncbi:helix-turn-helix domain-containing protein [Rhizobiales bacterium]|uniref:helix-turn-helix domain-containing protein n=1 Tax=Hongsoonwoonella zoysiae TaxID=2821844 RepID=UPI00156192B1|nr:AraC family transcriptional regulator [Hongsoonwoonella zoysiae]NRG16092.1 helix-turn-helix domain-containing protein [Hongsoonwoonella zoysiae]